MVEVWRQLPLSWHVCFCRQLHDFLLLSLMVVLLLTREFNMRLLWFSLFRSCLSGCHATLPRKGTLRDIPKDGCEGKYLWLCMICFVLFMQL